VQPAPPAASDAVLDAAAAGAGGGSEGLLDGKRKRAPRVTFRETHLLGDRGLWRLYREFQSLPLRREPGSEVREAV
jgi:hypothetical protein